MGAKVRIGAWLGAHRENAYICQVWGARGLFLLAGMLLSIIQGQTDPKHTPVPFTLADREKLIAIEHRLDYLEKRIDHLEKRIDRLEAEVADLRKEMRSYFLTTLILLVSLIGAMGVVFGYLLYERNKILVHLLKTQIDHEHRLQKLEAAWSAPPSS